MEEIQVITIVEGGLGNAGPKAPLDICRILEGTGGVSSYAVSSEEGMDYPLYLKTLSRLREIRKEGVLTVLQYPFQPFRYHENQKQFAELLKELDPCRTWIWIHDINQIRLPDRKCYDKEMDWLRPFRYFIVHNHRMEQYLRQYLNIEKCICNEVFDYLCRDTFVGRYRQPPVEREPEIVYAGNLVNSKSPFLYELSEEKMNFRINIYGKRETLIKNKKVNYCGSFRADILPDKLRGDLGLVWDGTVDAPSDTMPQRNYTRYNTPHKFSCYMAAGLPVIGWKDAAIADVIQKYQVGYLIENIYEINHLDYSQYETFCENARKLAVKVRDGWFTRKAFQAIQEMRAEGNVQF